MNDLDEQDAKRLAESLRAYEQVLDAVGGVSIAGLVEPDIEAIRVNGSIIERNAQRARERERLRAQEQAPP